MALTVLHFIICDQVRLGSQSLQSIQIDNLITSIRSKQAPPFPLTRPRLTALALFMGGQGEGELSIRIVYEQSGHITSHSKKSLTVRFLGDSRTITGIKINLPNCVFPSEGLYWVELVFSGEVIARQPIRVSS
ncbi:MAG: hypothetical protein EXR98_18115 [Gemmataceae bacterium]|nr:hypothetical protein [Gemmataceae bacterium]